MKKGLAILLLMAIGIICGQANANSILPLLPSHEDLLKELVKEGRITPEEAKIDLRLAEERGKEIKDQLQPQKKYPSSFVKKSTTGNILTSSDSKDEVNQNLAIGTVFSPKPAKRKIAGTERSVISAMPLYSLHDGKYLIPLTTRAILNGVITKNGYYYTVIGVEKNFFKLLFKKKYTPEETKKILGGDNPPFLVK